MVEMCTLDDVPRVMTPSTYVSESAVVTSGRANPIASIDVKPRVSDEFIDVGPRERSREASTGRPS